jgi:hypothetical protein
VFWFAFFFCFSLLFSSFLRVLGLVVTRDKKRKNRGKTKEKKSKRKGKAKEKRGKAEKSREKQKKTAAPPISD